MQHNYPDIRALTDIEPLWYDANGVPRFAKFDPELCPSIYAKEVLLVEVQCQSCDKRFHIERHWHPMFYMASYMEQMERGHGSGIGYGDPPYHGCSGDCMTTSSIRIVEFWSKIDAEWSRQTQYEIGIAE